MIYPYIEVIYFSNNIILHKYKYKYYISKNFQCNSIIK